MTGERPTKRCNLTDGSLEGVALETLAAFDTLKVQTANSEYRIFLLDPKTGRAVIEGGNRFRDPVDAIISGSWLTSGAFKPGWIDKGVRMEFWAAGQVALTSPVQSLHINRSHEVDSAALFI